MRACAAAQSKASGASTANDRLIAAARCRPQLRPRTFQPPPRGSLTPPSISPSRRSRAALRMPSVLGLLWIRKRGFNVHRSWCVRWALTGAGAAACYGPACGCARWQDGEAPRLLACSPMVARQRRLRCGAAVGGAFVCACACASSACCRCAGARPPREPAAAVGPLFERAAAAVSGVSAATGVQRCLRGPSLHGHRRQWHGAHALQCTACARAAAALAIAAAPRPADRPGPVSRALLATCHTWVSSTAPGEPGAVGRVKRGQITRCKSVPVRSAAESICRKPKPAASIDQRAKRASCRVGVPI